MQPGSHLATTPRPETATKGHHRPPWPAEFYSEYGMEVVQLVPGDCLIFSEKCLHATTPYTGQGERRTLFYKYMPYGARRASDAAAQGGDKKHYDLVTDGCITEAQKFILGWPEEWTTFSNDAAAAAAAAAVVVPKL